MFRAPRTTKAQKEFLISFLEENKILTRIKVNPSELGKVHVLWENMVMELNKMGPPKTIKAWKDTISEMKTKAKRRSREVRYGCQGTGGGGATKPLTPFEERILGLLVSELSVEGAQLSEAGVEMIVTEEELFELPVEIASTPGYVPPQPTPSTEPSHNIENIDSPPAISTRRRPRRVNRGRAGSRVTTAMELHDRQLANLARSNYAIASALNRVARAILSFRR
ncbi:uncharacterized protein [Diabrotica undecimpunctata]|uniref:uncharacterized protein n=1 Tax=Diabrotica undecimpunctata TaxID=50387 RepID=UPI003B63EA9C